MIYVGIDDTDVAGSRGTNQLARAMVAALAAEFRCRRIVRHQLLEDPRVPCTTKNGSASILLEAVGSATICELAEKCRALMLSDFIVGSDPGLCIASTVPPAVSEFGLRCKSELVERSEAEAIARRHGIFLEGLGGTRDGEIGALAAVGLAATGNDGRIVQIAQWPDDLSGIQAIDVLVQRGLVVEDYASGEPVVSGRVDVGKHLRPNRREGRDVLFVETMDQTHLSTYKALRLP